MKDWVVSLLILISFLCIFLGYFWRVYHEKKNWDKWSDVIRHEFLLEVTDPNNPNVIYYKQWQFIKRADGSVVIRRK